MWFFNIFLFDALWYFFVLFAGMEASLWRMSGPRISSSPPGISIFLIREMGRVSAKLLARLLPVSTLSLSPNIGTKGGPLKTQTYWARLYLNLMPNLQQEEIVAVVVILNFVGNSSVRELQKRYVNGSDRVRKVTAMHLRLLKCIYMMPTFMYFFQPWIYPHRTNSILLEIAGIEFNRNLGLLHSLQGKTELLPIRLHTFHLIHNWAKISSTLGFICLH